MGSECQNTHKLAFVYPDDLIFIQDLSGNVRKMGDANRWMIVTMLMGEDYTTNVCKSTNYYPSWVVIFSPSLLLSPVHLRMIPVFFAIWYLFMRLPSSVVFPLNIGPNINSTGNSRLGGVFWVGVTVTAHS